MTNNDKTNYRVYKKIKSLIKKAQKEKDTKGIRENMVVSYEHELENYITKLETKGESISYSDVHNAKKFLLIRAEEIGVY